MGKPPDWLRVVMHRECEEWVSQLRPENLDAFEISGHKWQRFPFRRFDHGSYPEHDICQRPPKGQFDIIFAEQVWEHLKYPYRAAQHVMSALRPGGYFLVTVPFMVRSHPHPLDCSRWSADGLRYFLEECGFDAEQIRADQWGNRDCLEANLDKWVRFDEDAHSLENDPKFPLVSWALARKPL